MHTQCTFLSYTFAYSSSSCWTNRSKEELQCTDQHTHSHLRHRHAFVIISNRSLQVVNYQILLKNRSNYKSSLWTITASVLRKDISILNIEINRSINLYMKTFILFPLSVIVFLLVDGICLVWTFFCFRSNQINCSELVCLDLGTHARTTARSLSVLCDGTIFMGQTDCIYPLATTMAVAAAVADATAPITLPYILFI